MLQVLQLAADNGETMLQLRRVVEPYLKSIVMYTECRKKVNSVSTTMIQTLLKLLKLRKLMTVQ